MTHKQYQAYKWYEQYESTQDINRESVEIVDQSQTQRYVSRFEPLLYVPALTQKDFHYNVHIGLPTQGTSTEDLGNTTLEVHNSSLKQQQPLHNRQGTKPHKINLSIEG